MVHHEGSCSNLQADAAYWATGDQKTHQAIPVLAHFTSCQVAIARAVNTRFSECTGALMNSMTIDEEVCVLLCCCVLQQWTDRVNGQITELHIRLHQQLRPVLLQQLAHAACGEFESCP